MELTLRFDNQLQFVEAETETEVNATVSDELIENVRNTISKFRDRTPKNFNQKSEDFHFSAYTEDGKSWSIGCSDFVQANATSMWEELYDGELAPTN